MSYERTGRFDDDEDKDELEDGALEDDPNDPRHPDFDLSESAPWQYLEEPAKPWFMRRWVFLILAVVIIFSLILPFLPR
jgi:hypothetical protein